MINGPKADAEYGRIHEMGEVFGVGIDTKPNWTPVCALSPTNSTNDVDIANARLIAAAPELLEALITAMPFVEDAADDEVYKSHRVHKVLKEIRAAIAKAQGEQT